MSNLQLFSQPQVRHADQWLFEIAQWLSELRFFRQRDVAYFFAMQKTQTQFSLGLLVADLVSCFVAEKHNPQPALEGIRTTWQHGDTIKQR